MSIHKIGSDIIRPFGPRGTKPDEAKADGEGAGRSPRARADRVGFSPEGLALAARALEVETGLAPERLDQIRARIADGFYDSGEVAEEVARRLVASGDLDPMA